MWTIFFLPNNQDDANATEALMQFQTKISSQINAYV